MSKAGIARVREKNRELGHDMVYGYRTENERVNQVVDFNAQRDVAVCGDTSMLHYPKWKSDEKSKFVSVVAFFQEKPFTTATKKFGLDKQKAGWKTVPFRESEKEDHKYIEGLEKLGNDILSKNRDRSQEV